MKKINLNCSLIDLDGKVIEKSNMAEIVANQLIYDKDSSKDAIKKYELALKINKKKEFEIDTSDFDLIEKVIKKSTLPVISVAQILLKLRETEKTKNN